MVVARVHSPTKLESDMRGRLGMELENSGNLRQYADGRALPFKKEAGPGIRRAVWPQRAQKRWPGTIEWLTTPFWFLLEHFPDAGDLMRCVALLPPRFREELLLEVDGARGIRQELAFVAPACVYELTTPLGPHALGAAACALRRARLSGDMGAERWCAVAVAWMLLALEAESVPLLRPLLKQLADTYLMDAAEHVYPNGSHAPITAAEVNRFHRERDAFLRWTVEEQIAAGDVPTWVERGYGKH
jgi:hypothetical protein